MSTYNKDDEKRLYGGSLPPLPDYRGIDMNQVNPLYGKPSQRAKGPEFIPYNKRGRDFYGRLSFNMGVLWLGGFTAGGAYGFVEGWRNAASPTYKIRFNSVMNAVSKRGASLGSSLGVVAFLHTCVIGLTDMVELDEKTHIPELAHILAGAVTGGAFFSSRGPRAAALAATLGGAASVGYWWVGNAFERSFGKGGRF